MKYIQTIKTKQKPEKTVKFVFLLHELKKVCMT